MKACGSACCLLFAVVCAASWNSASGTTTVAGVNCAPDHLCGTHGENYFWCYKDRFGARSSEWDYCCRPDHPCGATGYGWCNHGYGWNKWSYCHKVEFTIRKTVSGESCSPDNSCGQHGYSYNWCYVPAGWEYCCTPDHACAKHGKSYDWCWVGTLFTSWRKCQAA